MSSIRFALLALLTQGPAYGLQLRNELDRRLQRARTTNVGQVYSTLDRLIDQGLVSVDSGAEDGLPRYTLTGTGIEEATSWLHASKLEAAHPWESMVVQVLIARSLPGVDSSALLRDTRGFWEAELHRAQQSFGHDVASDLRSSADEALCLAALAWLRHVEATSDSGVPVSQERPKRGRPASQAS